MHDQSITPPTKPCRMCGESKPLGDFYLDRGRKDGRRNTCIACDKARKRTPEAREQSHRYYHSEKGKAAERRYYHEGKGRETRKAYNDQPDVKEKRKERQPAYTAKYNRSEKGKAWWKAYRASPEFKEMQRERRQRPEVKAHARAYMRVRVLIRYHRQRSLIANFTEDQWQHALDWFDNRCAYCGNRGPLAREHVTPVSANGPYTVRNIVPSCRSCNSSKKDKVMESWATAEAAARIHAYQSSLDTTE